MQNKEIDFLKNAPFAHRGMYNNNIGIPENSMASFKKAIDSYYAIELDVHVLKDGSVVVFHDDNLYRMTGVDKDIKDMSHNEISKLRLLNTNEKIPLLQEVLKLVDSKVPLLIELKCDVRFFKLENNVARILKGYNGKFAIQSFNPFSILYLRLKCPKCIRGQLIGNEAGGKIGKLSLSKILLNFITKPHFIACNINMLPSEIIKKYTKNKVILGWTVRSNEDLKIAKKYADNYIIENII